MRYFKAVMQMGHCGKGKYRDVVVYLFAETMTEAMDYAKNLPSIKHGKLPLSLVEITKEEYERGRSKNEYKKAISQGLGNEYEESNDLH